jgi:hypothetical protein
MNQYLEEEEIKYCIKCQRWQVFERPRIGFFVTIFLVFVIFISVLCVLPNYNFYPPIPPQEKNCNLIVPDSKSRNIPEVVLVRRWAVGILGIWRGGVGWVKGGAIGVSLQAT